MSTKMLVTMKLDQRLAMNQQLRQAIELLQHNTLELKQLIQQSIECNPFIELDEIELQNDEEDEQIIEHHHYSAYSGNGQKSSFDTDFIENYAKVKTLREHLLEQTLLCRFNQEQQMLAEAIIDAIDDDGFLTMNAMDIQQALRAQHDFSIVEIEAVLQKIKMLDPIGIGSRDIRECLLFQLAALPVRDNIWHAANQIITEIEANFSVGDLKKVIKRLKISGAEYTAAINLIRTLNFHPGAQYLSDKNLQAEPELYVKKIGGVWQVFLKDSLLTNLKINKQYHDLVKQNKKHEAYASLKQELEEARWLVNGLKRRNETLLRVASHIIAVQHEFLEHGKAHLKSMNIADVAQAMNVHESTVSRVTSGKYIATPIGVFELKYFFSSRIGHASTGEESSAVAVKTLIQDIINSETPAHVFSDNEIVAQLQSKGICVARRTVAKYREAMNILSSYQRQLRYSKARLQEEGDLVSELELEEV